MRGLYNILFTFFFFLSSPYYFLKMWRRGQWQEGFGQRFGRYTGNLKQALTNRHVLWLHAVSVGEVNVCTQLIRALEPRLPNLKLVVSTTSTGMEELRKRLPRHIDESTIRSTNAESSNDRFERLTRKPWSGQLKSGRIFSGGSETRPFSFPGECANVEVLSRLPAIRFSVSTDLRLVCRVGVKNEADAERMRQLGCRPEAIRIVGNGNSMPRDCERPLLGVGALLRQLGAGRSADPGRRQHACG